MNPCRVGFFSLAALFAGLVFLSGTAVGADSVYNQNDSDKSLKWLAIPSPEIEVHGLPWFETNAPELWRLPGDAKKQVPPAVWQRAVAPCGGRLMLRCDSSSLFIKTERQRNSARSVFFDAYVDGAYIGSVNAGTQGMGGLCLFDKKLHESKTVVIYLPHNAAIRVLAVGVDLKTHFEKPPPFSAGAPIVCYGSSVLQGTGASHPSKTYPAILARKLNVDFVNLGFGGAGKAEPEVVSLVNQLQASAFIFDLGKSYGDQPAEPYKKMLQVIRTSHPQIPIFCITPIYSTKEENDPAYRAKSERLRSLMRDVAVERRNAGDKLTYVVEGLDLFGKADTHFFHDALHPNDQGNEKLAGRLIPAVRKEPQDRK